MKNYFFGLIILLVLVFTVACSGETKETGNVANNDSGNSKMETEVNNDQSNKEETGEEIEESDDVIKEATEEKKEAAKEENTSSESVLKEESTSEKETSGPEPVVTTKKSTSKEAIDFKTIEQNDSNIEKGKTKVVQEGVEGTRTITYIETYEDGKFVSKEKVSSKTTIEPINRIISVGTKEPPVEVTGMQYPLAAEKNVITNELLTQAVKVLHIYGNGLKNRDVKALNNYIDKNIVDGHAQSSRPWMKSEWENKISSDIRDKSLLDDSYLDEYTNYLLHANKGELKVAEYNKDSELLNVYLSYQSADFESIGKYDIQFLFSVSPWKNNMYNLQVVQFYKSYR